MRVLFTFESKLDNNNYVAFWDDDAPVLRVAKASLQQPRPPAMPGSTYDETLIPAYEEGRLSQPKQENPYGTRAERADLAAAWQFGRDFNCTNVN